VISHANLRCCDLTATIGRHTATSSRPAPGIGQHVAASTGTGRSHLAIAIARACIRGGARGRFYTVVDLVNRLESEARASRQGRLAEYLTRMDFIILDELGYPPVRPDRRPAAVSPDQPAL
jgi:IstB-like ATP binding protein